MHSTGVEALALCLAGTLTHGQLVGAKSTSESCSSHSHTPRKKQWSSFIPQKKEKVSPLPLRIVSSLVDFCLGFVNLSGLYSRWSLTWRRGRTGPTGKCDIMEVRGVMNKNIHVNAFSPR